MNEQLRQARIDRRWTVNQAARKTGVGRSTYVRWEQGTQIPHESSLMLACKAFDRSPEELGFQLAISGSQAPAKQATQSAYVDSIVPSRCGQEDLWQLTVQSFLDQQQAEAAGLAGQQEIVYDCLEVTVLTLALRWQQSSGSLRLLQQLVTEAIRNHDTMHHDPEGKGTSLTRRQALQTIALLPIQLYGLTHLPLLPSQLPAQEMLSLCAAGLTACTDLKRYQPEGISAIGQILSAYLPTLKELAHQSTPTQKEAASLAAQGYLLADFLADYAGRLDQSETASRAARFYGRIACDPNLEVAALARLAIKYDYERQDIKALETYQEALALPEFAQVSPLLQGKVYLGLAATHAYCERNAEALSFLSQAREVFPKDAQADPSYLFASTDSCIFALWEGLTLKHTGYYPQAVDAFKSWGSFEPRAGLLEMNRAEFLNYTASVAVRERDLEMASAYLGAAEEVATSIRHQQRQSEIRETLRGMQLLWPREPEVKRLQEQIYSRRTSKKLED